MPKPPRGQPSAWTSKKTRRAGRAARLRASRARRRPGGGRRDGAGLPRLHARLRPRVAGRRTGAAAAAARVARAARSPRGCARHPGRAAGARDPGDVRPAAARGLGECARRRSHRWPGAGAAGGLAPGAAAVPRHAAAAAGRGCADAAARLLGLDAPACGVAGAAARPVAARTGAGRRQRRAARFQHGRRGRAWRDWQRAGRPQQPGRLNERWHVVFKDADTLWRRARPGIAALLGPELFREGLDGEAVDWAAARLLLRDEPRKLLLVLSDGCPPVAWSSTCARCCSGTSVRVRCASPAWAWGWS